MSELNVLGGPVSAQFSYHGNDTDFRTALEACQLEQEEMCGYKLMPTSSRSAPVGDPVQGENGLEFGWEVFVTFSPAPLPAPPDPADATQV